MAETILVTGASAGFGKAIAQKFASQGFNLVITGRRGPLLEQLKKELESAYGVAVWCSVFDIRNKEEVNKAVSTIPDRYLPVRILINNAGLAAGRDYFDEASLDDWEQMIDTNLKGLLYMSKAILPSLLQSSLPHIFNIGSTAGKEVYERGNVYCATKHAVDAISKAMRMDLLRHKIKVTAIHPGAAETEFSMVRFKGDSQKADAVYEGYEPLHAEDIANVVWFCAGLPPHVCINDLVMTCTAQANSFLTFKG